MILHYSFVKHYTGEVYKESLLNFLQLHVNIQFSKKIQFKKKKATGMEGREKKKDLVSNSEELQHVEVR